MPIDNSSETVSLEDIDNIDPEQLRDLRDCFDILDTDKNGQITVDEFKYTLTKLNIFLDKEEVQDLIWEYDTDGDNSLDFEEFVQLVAKIDPIIGQDIELNKAFKLFDQNQDGFITRSEVSEALTRFGISASEADVDLLFSTTDHNNDGLINHTEFRNMLYDAPPLLQPGALQPGARSRPASPTKTDHGSKPSSPLMFRPRSDRTLAKYIRSSYTPSANIMQQSSEATEKF